MSTIEQVVPEGYKTTDVGVIPNDWKASILGDFVRSLEAGISVNSVDKREAFSHGKHILKTSCVSKGYFYPKEAKSIIPKDISRAKTIPTEGAIIISRMNTPDLVGELGFIEETYSDLFLPDRLWQMRFRSSAKTNTRWLAYILSFPAIAQKIKESATGTSNSMKNISKGSLLSITFPAPEFEEQTAIANALSDVDALLTELENLIAKKQAIKTASMQQLLTGKTRLPQFATYTEGNVEGKSQGQPKGTKPSELGEIPEDWDVEKIGSVVSITTGSRNTQDKLSSGKYPFFVRSQTIERIDTYSFDGEAVLTAGDGVGTGKIFHYINGKFDYHQRVYLMHNFGERVNGYYFYIYFSNFFYDRIMSMTAKSSVDSVRREMIADMLITLPPKEEQTAIATILSDMDNEIQTLEQRLTKTRQIKQGMMQELLTGRTRLPY
ncbi:restriction endonuclease subunit S [Pseudoalteromonas tunicata]|uniref:restriction endonuclease subunit S n=1 Tax=Pseudoalteromonas tunicata TaxID=314281 RepID=UPI00273F82FE|nr:restriction endonuclease subunit S [Pseudoalteromonas tunicata]MDP5212571.1 restriction endonuclease subunit S [Pseudoalteromonas tunicata]